MLSSDDLVTGEAVALDLPPASVASRIGSGSARRGLDGRRRVLRAVPARWWPAPARTTRSSTSPWSARWSWCSWCTRRRSRPSPAGKSLGKLVLGLRVVRDDGGTVTAQQAFVRALVGDRGDLRTRRRSGVLLLPGELARASDSATTPPARTSYATGSGSPCSRRRRCRPRSRLGAGRRPPHAAGRARRWRSVSTSPGCRRSTRRRGSASASSSPPGWRRTSRPHRRRAPRPGTSWLPSVPPVATATWPGCTATSRCARGSSSAVDDGPPEPLDCGA